jgi:hypothetical protein
MEPPLFRLGYWVGGSYRARKLKIEKEITPYFI